MNIDKLSPEQRARLALQLSKRADKKQKADSQHIPRLERRDHLPLSFAQQRLWFLAQLVPDSPFYNVPTLWLFNGELSMAALEQSLNEIVRRHEVLRTVFPAEAGEPRQVILPPEPVPLPVVHLQHLREAEQDAQIQRYADQEAARPFDLAKGPLLRASLLHLSSKKHVLLLNLHHIIFDGWSSGVLIMELTALYQAFAAGLPSPLAELPVQYADFAQWQRQMLQGANLERHLNYWKQQLDGAPTLLNLPTDYPRPEIQSFRGTYTEIKLPGRLSAALKALSDQQGTTLFMTMLAAFSVLLYRYTQQEDIVIGSGIAGRNYREIEELIGFFVNALPIRTNLSGDPSFLELLERVRGTTIGAYAHQELPFEKLVEELQPERKLSHAPIFQVSFVYQNFPDLPPGGPEFRGASSGSPGGDAPFLSFYLKPVFNRTSKFDLTLYLLDGDEQILSAEYNSDLFEASTIERLLGHFLVLLEGIAAHPEGHISSFPVMPWEERQKILLEWNETQTPYAEDACLQQLFEAQVEHSPKSLALISGDEELDYHTLNRRANQLAHYLQRLGVGPETRVGVCLERSVDMIVAVLAILKAGGAYVPLDPNYPADRLAFMLSDSVAPILVTWEASARSLPLAGVQRVYLDVDWPSIAEESGHNPASEAAPDNLAYIIYTSGSTGQPKGTMLAHRGVCNMAQAQRKAFAIEPGSRVCQFASFSFDASVSEIFATLLAGATLVLPAPGPVLPGKDLVDLLQAQRVTTMTCTPSVWAMLPEQDLPQLKMVVSAGEACPASVVAQWSPGRRFINGYGPTEASVCTTLDENVSDNGKPSIGRPIDNVQVYILDPYLQPVPIGVAGELYIGGVSLARGYWRQPALTAERFIPNPFVNMPGSNSSDKVSSTQKHSTPNPFVNMPGSNLSNKGTSTQERSAPDPFANMPGARLYRTGDLTRYLPSGNIEFLGRVDQQIKLRGFRVELGEIESVLEQHPAVRQAVVAPYTPEGGREADKQLVAYLVLDKGELRKLEKELPELDIEGEQILQWQQLFDDNYGRHASSQDPTFNVAGWNSSYTGLPIPEEEMREWVDQTVARILAHRPRRVLEIGCGTGLLLFRIAPHCEMYWGTDFSDTALGYIRRTMAETNLNLPQVRLLRQTADDLTGIPFEMFDMVILNSVAQYFPSAEYLVSVLEKAAKVTRPGGCIFVGDVRNLTLLEAFQASVGLYKAFPSQTVSELWQRVQRRVNEEEELAIDPAFFEALQHYLPRISHVEMLLKRGRAHNELTKFRYDAFLYIDTEWPQVEPARLDWQAEQLTLTAVHRILSETGPQALVITRVPNARLQADLQALALISASAGTESVGELRKAVLYNSEDGVDPEAFWDLDAALPYVVSIGCSDAGRGSYDVIFRQQSAPPMRVRKRESAASPRPWHHYANNSLQRITALRLVPHLRLFLQDALPDYMVPSSFVVLDSLRLGPNGKVDRQALPAPSSARRSVADGSLAVPRDPIELQLAHIWEDVLQVNPVGVTDNFFDLGGHSLLAVALMARIEKHFGEELPLAILFQYPTIEHLASILREKIGFISRSALVPIQPNGSKPPFFCVHPAGGNVICYTDLARCLGPDQPFFGLQDPWLAGECEPLTTVEEMASHYIKALCTVQPQGPYLLGGWSFGAFVALEMARQLQEAGQEIALLAVFDTVAPRLAEGELDGTISDATLTLFVLQEVGRTFGISLDIPPAVPEEYQSADMTSFILERFQEAGMDRSQAVHLLEYGQRYAQVYKRNMVAEAHYAPRSYHGTITLFKSQDMDPQEMDNPRYAEPLYGWDKLSPAPVEVHMVPCTHHTILYEPSVRAVAERLQACLETAREKYRI